MVKSIMCFVMFLLIIPNVVECQIKEKNKYKMLTRQGGFVEQVGKRDTNFIASSGDIFELLKITDSTFVVRFTRVGKIAPTKKANKQTLYQNYIFSPVTNHLTHFSGNKSIIQNPLPESKIKIGVNYVIYKDFLPEYNIEENNGIAYGVLTVPVKIIPGIQSNTDFDILPGGTFDGFLGYRQNQFIFGGSAGLGAIATSKLNENKLTSILGVNLCIGIIWEPIKNSGLGFGILGGTDIVTDKDYPYSGKGWFCISSGYRFRR